MLDDIRQPAIEPMPRRDPDARQWQAWTLRILPPLLLLWPLSTRNGTTLYLCGILLLPTVLWSFVIVAANLIRWQPVRLVRPTLCIAIAVGWVAYLGHAMAPAVRYADTLAARIQARCNANGRCPPRIEGWTTQSAHVSTTTYGEWVKWRIEYRSAGAEFGIWIRIATDINRVAMGGVGRKLVRIGKS